MCRILGMESLKSARRGPSLPTELQHMKPTPRRSASYSAGLRGGGEFILIIKPTPWADLNRRADLRDCIYLYRVVSMLLSVEARQRPHGL